MKKVIVLMMTVALFISCHKSNNPSTPGTEVTSGKLIFQDPDVDGAGLFYKVETTEEILILNPNAAEDPHIKYAAFLDVHTTMSFTDTGKKGCLGGFAGCNGSYRIIDVISMKKE